MEQRNNKQNSMIFEIEDLLNKMSKQVDFLIRKNLPMNQLDIDLLMENTRKLYDTLCSVELRANIDSVADSVHETIETDSGEHVDMIWDFTNNETDLNSDEEIESDNDSEFETESEVESEIESESDSDFDEEIDPVSYYAEADSDDHADMIWDFTNNNEASLDTDKEIESDNDSDSYSEEETDSDNDSDFSSDEKNDSETDSGIRAYRKTNNEYHTIGDIMELAEDNSLAARLQRKPVADLMTAIGINDKFLFLNELFGGSMEKYNRSIRSLNNFSTFLGAKTYMNELQIEFQWDCNSDAYKKLNDLIERRFVSIHNY